MKQVIPRAEYPRPGFKRKQWENLNGEWEFYNDFCASGEDRHVYLNEKFPDKIIVPFCPESKLSGIGFKDFMPSVWYARNIEITEKQLCGDIVLHIGACDYQTTVYCNGEKVGVHSGGYTSFEFSLRGFAVAGTNRIVIHVEDDLRSRKQPSGKQSRFYESSGCVYSRTTGIWQTVWLEFLPTNYIRTVKINATDLEGYVFLKVFLNKYCENAVLRITVSFENSFMLSCEKPLKGVVNDIAIRIPEVHLWNVGEPNLYDIDYCLIVDGEETDFVQSYLGIRRIDIDGFKVRINGKAVFQRLVLDQGYYPEGIYTAPTDADLKRDIELAMKLGFNGARLHEKVFEERYLYYADRLGYLVWGEYPNWGLDHTSHKALHTFLPEWLECIERDYNHPSIIGWCPYNETFDINFKRQIESNIEIVYQATKAVDSTRPVIDTSGYMHTCSTDIYDVHDYEQDTGIFLNRYRNHAQGQFFNNYCERQCYTGKTPFFVSEYGGIKWRNPADGKDMLSWGYGDAPNTEEEFISRYERLSSALLAAGNIMGFCYTQLTDVEQEQNGLYYYDRSEKLSRKAYTKIRAINMKKAKIEE